MASNLTDLKNDWINKNRDRINLTVPKRKKEIYSEYAKAQGMSLTKFITEAVEEKISREERTEHNGR